MVDEPPTLETTPVDLPPRISMVGKWTLIREDNPAFFPVPFDAREGPFWSDRSPAFLVIAGAS
jgi:hypothetical protein